MESRILTINGGSSTIKFAVYTGDAAPQPILRGQVDGIGQTVPILTAIHNGEEYQAPINGKDHRQAAEGLIAWISDWSGKQPFTAVGHRVVHGGAKLNDHQIVTDELLQELHKTQPLDLAHLPREIALIKAFRSRFQNVPQIACFDTVFHRDLPRIARLLPIPRRYTDAGVRRLGFHGLSYMYLIETLRRIDSPAANGRVILAHLGSGSSLTAMHKGAPVDTTMAFTPTSGVMMGTRPGDLDPGLLVYLLRSENLPLEQMDDFVSQRCGLLGVSGITSDMRELMKRRASDTNAADAIDLFCYQIKKCIGSFATVLGGMETLVFSGGIGEHSPETRAGICAGMESFGIDLDPERNRISSQVISGMASRVTVRVIPTDEEFMVAKIVLDLIAGQPDRKV
jgi:acetate kinase